MSSLDKHAAQRSYLKMLLKLPLEAKIELSKTRIKEWYDHHQGQVVVSFSGGKDSTVMLHLVRSLYPDVKACFVDTGLEYPEIVKFVKTFENVDIIKPKETFLDVIKKYGYPVVSKQVSGGIYSYRTSKNEKFKEYLMSGKGRFSIPEKWKYLINADFPISRACCHHLKKAPAKAYHKHTGLKPYVGTMVEESQIRLKAWLEGGCNVFSGQSVMSKPLSFWTDDDVTSYRQAYGVPICSVYSYYSVRRTGCVFCLFGLQHDQPGENRFQLLAHTHPQLHEYCRRVLHLDHVCEVLGQDFDPMPHLFEPQKRSI